MSDTYSDLIGTVYPDKIDTFENKVDVSIVTSPYVAQYKELLNSGDVVGAQKLLETYPILRQSAITAQDFNKLQDAIIAVQRFFKREGQQVLFSTEEPSGESAQSVGDVWVKTYDDGAAEMYELTENGYVLRFSSNSDDLDALKADVTKAQSTADSALTKANNHNQSADTISAGTFRGDVATYAGNHSTCSLRNIVIKESALDGQGNETLTGVVQETGSIIMVRKVGVN